ncbi:hypothetical protein GCM10007079_27920 [Nocardiopsis terrae]|nr:hypothetical protein GCM10007079_27920 [Nocardiopsis terrae]
MGGLRPAADRVRPGTPVLTQLRDRYVRSVREMPGDWTGRYLATRGLAARTPALRDQHTDATDRLRARITEALEEAFGADGRQDVRLRLAADRTLSAVRYLSCPRVLRPSGRR